MREPGNTQQNCVGAVLAGHGDHAGPGDPARAAASAAARRRQGPAYDRIRGAQPARLVGVSAAAGGSAVHCNGGARGADRGFAVDPCIAPRGGCFGLVGGLRGEPSGAGILPVRAVDDGQVLQATRGRLRHPSVCSRAVDADAGSVAGRADELNASSFEGGLDRQHGASSSLGYASFTFKICDCS
jgi:hypothetical protein